jgi:heat shock protein HtpX
MYNIYNHRDSNIRATRILFVLFFGLIIAIGWFLSRFYNQPSILVIAVIFSSFMSFLSYWFSDKIVLSMSRAIPVSMENAPELYRVVENLAITAGLPAPKIYLIPEKAPNAFATGRDPEHAVIAVTQGLLEKLDRTELEGVISHELSHIGNRDILIGTVAIVLVGFISIAADIFLRSSFFGRRSDRGNGGSGVFALIGLVFVLLAPIAATLLRLAVSRNREFLADSSGVLLTRYPEGLAAALEKISSDQTPMRMANNSAAHLWIDNPFRGKQKKSLLNRLFMTHPPAEERIRRLRETSA